MAEFEKMLPPHEASLHLTHNDHKAVYETVAEWIDHRESMNGPLEFTSPDERARAIETGELWELQWYPRTPVSFHHVCASSLAAILEWVLEQGFSARV